MSERKPRTRRSIRDYSRTPPDWCEGCGYYPVTNHEHRKDCSAR